MQKQKQNNMSDWNNDLGDDVDDREMCDHDFERDEEKDEIVIKRVLKLGETPCFKIYVNGEITKHFFFHLDAKDGDLYHESVNLSSAKLFVDELRNFKESETIIDY